MPYNLNQIKHIRGPLYEGYVTIAEETYLSKYGISNHMKYAIADFRQKGYFVKKIYEKYRVMDVGATIMCFELVKLKNPIIEHSF